MHRWPAVDPALRRRMLVELRRRQNREDSRLTPAERLTQLDSLLAVARALGKSTTSASDESAETMTRAMARFRAVDGRD